jgi:hypothetical protein
MIQAVFGVLFGFNCWQKKERDKEKRSILKTIHPGELRFPCQGKEEISPGGWIRGDEMSPRLQVDESARGRTLAGASRRQELRS